MPESSASKIDPAAASAAPTAGTRRHFLQRAAGAVAPLIAGQAVAQSAAGPLALPPTAAATEPVSPPPPVVDAPSRRIGVALVGLGHLTLENILPAFGRSKHCKPVALVSGDRAKAQAVARQYDIRDDAIYDYASFDRIAQNAEVDVVYIVLPNGMHAEFTVRAAKAGKHVLCEKPMANSQAECRQMIDACKSAGKQLMVAYRSQYEPHNRAIVKLVQQGKLGKLKEFISTNSQNMGDPGQWRLNKKLAGGGALPDVGVYCLNSVRFLTGEEPSEVIAWTYSTPNDPRFREVEETVHFILRFPSGLQATCHTSYGAHKSQFFRLLGTEGWVELDPAYAYHGIKMRHDHVDSGREFVTEPSIEEKDQFALEMDHFAECVRSGRTPYSTGEDGLQDQRIVEAIYASARANGKPIALRQPDGPLRGAEPADQG